MHFLSITSVLFCSALILVSSCNFTSEEEQIAAYNERSKLERIRTDSLNAIELGMYPQPYPGTPRMKLQLKLCELAVKDSIDFDQIMNYLNQGVSPNCKCTVESYSRSVGGMIHGLKKILPHSMKYNKSWSGKLLLPLIASKITREQISELQQLGAMFREPFEIGDSDLFLAVAQDKSSTYIDSVRNSEVKVTGGYFMHDWVTTSTPNDVLERLATNHFSFGYTNEHGNGILTECLLDGGNIEKARVFVDFDVDVDQKNVNGWTTLLEAAKVGDVDFMVYLLCEGANGIYYKSAEGLTALEILLKYGHYAAIKKLSKIISFSRIHSKKDLAHEYCLQHNIVDADVLHDLEVGFNHERITRANFEANSCEW